MASFSITGTQFRQAMEEINASYKVLWDKVAKLEAKDDEISALKAEIEDLKLRTRTAAEKKEIAKAEEKAAKEAAERDAKVKAELAKLDDIANR